MPSGKRAVMTEARYGPSSDPAIVAKSPHHRWHWGGIEITEFIGHCFRRRDTPN